MIDPVIKESIEKRIAQLEAEKPKVIDQANAQLNALAGAIGELRKLIADLEAPNEEEE